VPKAVRILLHIGVSAILALLVLPAFVVVPASFNAASFIRLPPAAFSMRWYGGFFQDPEWLSSLATSAEVAALATGLSLSLGTLAALGLARLGGALRTALYGLFLSPLIVPTIVTAIALYYVSRPLGLVGTIPGLALGHTLLCLPFVLVNVGVSLHSLDPALLRAAEGLGAGPWRVFRTVTMPIIAPGLLGGAVFAVITSFDEVVISIFLSGITAKTLPVKMWETIRVEFTPVVAVAATFLILLTLTLFALLRLFGLRQAKPAESLS